MVVLRMNATEYAQLQKLYRQSACRQLSGYFRKVALQQPVTIIYRNQTADDFLTHMLALKHELSAIGNNFNQAVHKLHTLDRIPEFRQWIMAQDQLQQTLVEKIGDIKNYLQQIHQQWSQK